MENPVEIDKILENINFDNKVVDAEYVLEENNQIEIEMKNDDRNNDNELKNGDLRDKDNNLCSKK